MIMNYDDIPPFGSVPEPVYEPPQLLVQDPIDLFLPSCPHGDPQEATNWYLRIGH